MKKEYFDPDIEPACGYCERGISTDGKTVLCKYAGIVSYDFSCRRFQYAPLKRKPRPLPILKEYDPEDFKL